MTRLVKVGVAAAVLAAAAMSFGAWADEGPLGVWIDHTGRGAVEITRCGEALCGKVVWVADKANAEGCGLEILGNVKPMGDGTYDEGWIYDPDKDAKFDVKLVPQGNGKLTVVGYKGIKLLSQTFTWTRAPDNLARSPC
ncbi:MAG: DUF2147 domain-containing protein [Hyphomicrobium sp.]|uniref:DUF2147 domain-containing protein n=1 Tax=Hyphomicrobium sp. TaxID=82 RepID=UPI00132791CB|nr:DUF2147 domain-containing protein [Hyphomicrobium sp.]KAB2941441.1 MAG: DUF2147 domain-containing protein [Hyphomicrobium sp.]MBZ0212099.1 DUF2147 domain-containing protein [Hyphomicrobium sp.]